MMRFIRRFFEHFIGRWRPQSAEPPDDLLHSRFLTSKSSHFTATKGYVKYAAFMPSRKDPDPRLSVFRIDSLSKQGIQRLAQDVARQGSRRIYGWAEFTAAAVRLVGLRLIPDESPPRHASITGWPREKHARQALATDLAERSALRHEGSPWIDESGRLNK